MWEAIGQMAGQAGGLFGQAAEFGLQRKWNVQASRHQRKWAEYMSNTAYQRATEDLRKAGLNPMLAYTQGGAGTPAYGSPGAPTGGDWEFDVGKVVTSAKERELMQAQIDTQEWMQEDLSERARVSRETADILSETGRDRALADIAHTRALAQDAMTSSVWRGPRSKAEIDAMINRMWVERANVPIWKEWGRGAAREWNVERKRNQEKWNPEGRWWIPPWSIEE